MVICGQLAVYTALMGGYMDWLRWFMRNMMEHFPYHQGLGYMSMYP
jgi:hypothetical protein